MAAKLGSFKYNFQEKREHLFSVQKGYSGLGFIHIEDWVVQMGQSDPRNIVFARKMKPFKQLSRYSVWAILTVVVMFEFSIELASSSRWFDSGDSVAFLTRSTISLPPSRTGIDSRGRRLVRRRCACGILLE
ncbi:aluminum-activated malate transporter 9-like [Pyrus ussuriensis x Pyrus communis]|uniref:Aluminum-activated malate transporter 9-like n=1 Tax=Pyrus ussuriensis x Pyrus communis TaxID=2448454 RepID=A0A5N5F378_9ROSA|nr:aluminum-activated malate transporter 9-like [Pyrus ussuriensis x Pyrus communis]